MKYNLLIAGLLAVSGTSCSLSTDQRSSTWSEWAQGGVSWCRDTWNSVCNRRGTVAIGALVGGSALYAANKLYRFLPETYKNPILGIATVGLALIGSRIWSNTTPTDVPVQRDQEFPETSYQSEQAPNQSEQPPEETIENLLGVSPAHSEEPVNLPRREEPVSLPPVTLSRELGRGYKRIEEISQDQTIALSPSSLNMNVGGSSTINRRSSMEDAHNMVSINISGKRYQLFGVYDGHGGSEMSASLKKELPNAFLSTCRKPYRRGLTVDRLLIDSLEQVEKNNSREPSGSTAVVAVLDNDDNMLHIANVGDSRAVVIRNNKVVLCTKDHKPNDPDEKARIEQVGGEIYDYYGTWYINFDNRGLAVSRAFGNCEKKQIHPGVLIAIPDMYAIKIQPGDRLIMASDGLWDKFADDASILQVSKDAQEAESTVSKQAAYLQDQAIKKGSSDNITVIVVDFS